MYNLDKEYQENPTKNDAVLVNLNIGNSVTHIESGKAQTQLTPFKGSGDHPRVPLKAKYRWVLFRHRFHCCPRDLTCRICDLHRERPRKNAFRRNFKGAKGQGLTEICTPQTKNFKGLPSESSLIIMEAERTKHTPYLYRERGSSSSLCHLKCRAPSIHDSWAPGSWLTCCEVQWLGCYSGSCFMMFCLYGSMVRACFMVL